MTSDYFPIRLPGLITYIQHNKPAEWGSYLIGQIGSVDEISDRRTPDLGDVACTESFADNPVAYFGALAAITSPSQSVFMVASTTGRIQFVHSLQLFRSRDGTASFFGLSGFGSIASPVIIPHEAFLRSAPVRGPPISRILKRMSFSTDGVSDVDFVRYSSRPVVPVPYFLSSFLIGTNLVDTDTAIPAFDVLRALKTACDSLDVTVGEHQLDWCADSEFLIPFLFLADSAVTTHFGVDLNQPVELNASLTAWVSRCHSVLGGGADAAISHTTAAASMTTTAPAAADTTTPASDHHNTAALPHGTTNLGADTGPPATTAKQAIQDEVIEQLKKNFAQSLSLQRAVAEAVLKNKDDTNQTKKAWSKIAAGRRRMALAAASTDGEHPAVELPESGIEFITAPVASAKSLLESSVKSRFPRFLVSYQPLLVQHLRALLLVWSTSDVPDGFSIFFTPSCRPEVGDSRAAIAASLEESNSAGLSAETVQAHLKS